MYCAELENKATLFITEPRAGHTHPAISCFTEIKLIGLSIILKNIDGLKRNKKQNYTKQLLQKYLRNVSVLSEVFKKKYFSIQRYFIRSICCCPAEMISRYRETTSVLARSLGQPLPSAPGATRVSWSLLRRIPSDT